MMRMKFIGIMCSSILSIFLMSGCIGDVDLTGWIRSADRAEDRFKASEAINATKPFKQLFIEQENYQIIVAADVHIGTTENFSILIDNALQPGITALVLAGDITSGKEEDYNKLIDLLPSNTQLPSFLMVGNHELYFDGWEHFYRFFGSSVYYFSIETPTRKDLYICLDSGGGTLGESQLGWLKRQLKDVRGDYDLCVVLTHNNFFRNRFTNSTTPNTEEVLLLMDWFERYKVNMVVMGHDHVRAENKLGNTLYLTLDALKDGVSNASYVVLERSTSGLQYRFIPLN